MSAARIRSRKRADGTKTHLVVYRRGGRAFPEEYAGTFALLREARTRRDLVGGWLAQGVDPRSMLAALHVPPVHVPTLAERVDSYLASRLDLAAKTKADQEGYIRNRLLPAFGHLRPDAVTVPLIQAWIADLVAADAKPSSIRSYKATLAQVLDHCGIDPNPARSGLLRMPTREDSWAVPPSDRHVLAILEGVTRRWRLPLAVIEQTGVRAGELAGWALGDLDETRGFVLSRPEVTKGRRGTRRPRWVQLPGYLFDLVVADLPPLEDRDPAAKVFPGFSVDGIRHAMAKACAAAGVPHYHPHDLRHRRISLWHAQGIPAREIGDRVGQRLVATTLDTYTHSMPAAEVTEADLRRLLGVNG